MNFILYDEIKIWKKLFPITFTRPISEIRMGLFTIKNRWEKYLDVSIKYVLSKSFLLKKYSKCSIINEEFENVLLINSSCIPIDKKLIKMILSLDENECILFRNNIVAIRKKNFSCKDYFSNYQSNSKYDFLLKECKKYYYVNNVVKIQYLWDIFMKNSDIIKHDFYFFTKNKKSNSLSGSNIVVLNKKDIFLESPLITNNVILDAKIGPIYIDKEVEIMEGSIIKGPVSIGQKSTIYVGSNIYGGTSIGYHCKIGGEVRNSIFLSYSNKSHNGFSGNSIFGEWCNLGAGTNISNLRNDYCSVKIWDFSKNIFMKTNIQFFGVAMGDHSKSSINTQFNTATLVGIGANIFGYGFPPKWIPSFSIGGIQNTRKVSFKKFCTTADIVMKRRNKKFSILEEEILIYLYQVYNI